MPRQKKEINQPDKLDAVLSAIQDVTKRLETVEQAIRKPITSEAPELMNKPQLEPTNEQTKAPESQVSYPIPADWRSAVDSLLNSSFGLELEYQNDAPLTKVIVVCPTKYSTATKDQLAVIGGRDIRPKLITNAGGLHELNAWLKQVYVSFSPETQALITQDRQKVTV